MTVTEDDDVVFESVRGLRHHHSEHPGGRRVRDERACAHALVGRLLEGLLDRGVEPRTGCRAQRLLVEDGRVVGVPLTGPDGPSEARVLDVDGDRLPGLYAAGNTMASVMGMTYGDRGGTLGPALVLGLRAGRSAARAAQARAQAGRS